MNDLEAFVAGNQGKVIQKWKHYLAVYDRYFSRYRNSAVSILEIGIQHGGSLEMWKNYFGTQAKIYGVDVNPRCKELEDDQTEVFIGDQEDRAFLRRLKAAIPRIDIIIDDGGHTMKQQIVTFEELFPHVSNGGVYLCEDMGTSYRSYFGGGYKRKGTFVEFSKGLVDSINAWFCEDGGPLTVNHHTESISAMHFFPGILVIEKQSTERPVEVITGNFRLPADSYINPLNTTLPFSVRSAWRRFRERQKSQ